MSVISGEYLRDVGSSATYVIEIKDFKKKLAETQMGTKISTKEFFVNWSKFSIDLFLAGHEDDMEDQSGIGVYITNKSDWMVRTVTSVYVKNVVLMAFPQGGQVQESNASIGWNNCVPHSRCIIGDLLSEDGTLILELMFELLGENIVGGGSRNGEVQELKEQLTKEMTGLKHKLDSQETELFSVRSKLRKVQSELQDVNRGFQPAQHSANTVKCPVCIKVVARPMRLQQCPKVRLFLVCW